MSSTRDYLDSLAARQPTPGGGAAAAISAAHACALGEMAAQYTTGKKWGDRSVYVLALIAQLQQQRQQLLIRADDDATAYGDLQRSWTDTTMSAAEKTRIEQYALRIPCDIFAICVDITHALSDFLSQCNPMILSDAQAAIHLCTGAAHAAYHTVLVNAPPAQQAAALRQQLGELRSLAQATITTPTDAPTATQEDQPPA